MKHHSTTVLLLTKIPKINLAAVVMLLGYLGILIWDQLGWWTTDEEYHFGFLIPLFAGFVFMERWPLIRSILEDGGVSQAEALSHTQMPGWLDRSKPLKLLFGFGFSVLLLVSMLVFLLGGVVRLAEGGLSVPSSVLFASGFAGVFLAVPFVFFDRDFGAEPIPLSRRLTLIKLLIFPALVWLLASPLPGFIKSELKLFLLNKVIHVVYFSFEMFGLPLIKEGNTFILPEGRVGVADACSGIRSLTGCVVTGAFLAAVSMRKWYSKLALLAASILLAVVSNLFRSLFLTAWAYAYGGDSINGFVHDATGYAVLGLTALGLGAIVWVMSLANRDWSSAFVQDDKGEK
jgi:exosortase/archaeosortase family protein